MSHSHALQTHIVQLEEIRSILNAMKNLSFMEIHKLSRLQIMQNQALSNIEQAATDFLSFYPELNAELGDGRKHTAIVVGSERGFCGDFNESLMDALTTDCYTNIIVIGNRLIHKTATGKHPVAIVIPGANIAEDVPSVINQLIETITSMLQGDNTLNYAQTGIHLTAVYHDQQSSQIEKRQLFPIKLQPGQIRRYFHPPVLNLDMKSFYVDLMHHYLFGVFRGILYAALTAENHSRLRHLEGAVNHLDDANLNLRKKLQTYRQEEITEEIEVILLNTEHAFN